MVFETKVDVMFLKLLFTIAMANYIYPKDYSTVCDLSDAIVPKHYNITLALPPKMNSMKFFYGKSSVLIDIRSKTEHISMHIYHLQISEEKTLLLNYEKNEIHRLQKYNYCVKSQIMTLTFKKELSPGLYFLQMNYTGTVFENQGLIISYYQDENEHNWFSYMTAFEPTGARHVFPCWDIPTVKTTFSISIVHADEYTTVSNVPLRNEVILGHGMMRTNLEITPVISTNLLSFAIVHLMSVHNIYNNIYMWCRPQMTEHVMVAQNVALKVEQFFIWYFKRFQATSEMNFIVAPRISSTIVGNSRFTVFKEKDIIYDETLHFPGQKISVATVVAQEISHQWFESVNRPTQWTEKWLHKAFDLYFGVYALNETYEDRRLMDIFVVQIHQSALRNDIYLNVTAVAEEHDPFYTYLVNNKAGAILRMLQYIVTKVILRPSIENYMSHEVQNTSISFLKTVQEKVVQMKGDKYTANNLEQIMFGWLKQRYYPVLTVKGEYNTEMIQETGNETFYIYITANSVGKDSSQWHIPITYTTKSELNFHHTSPRLWLREYNSEVIKNVNPSDWVIFNIQQTGYYRVHYDTKNWLKIAQYLNSKYYKRIHVLNRAQIIDDACYFLMEDSIDYSTFLALTKYLIRETDYIPWYSMINNLWYISPYFEFPESIFFKDHMLSLLNGLLQNIGYDENPTDDDMRKALRLLATWWTCKLGYGECRKYAYFKLKKHLEDPEEHLIRPWWEEWTYCMGLQEADINTWQQSSHMILRKNDKKNLEYLSCANDDLIITKLIKKTLTKEVHFDNLAEDTRIKLYISLIKRHARKEKVLSTILMNFEKIQLRGLSETDKLIHIIMSLYSKQHLNKLITFIKYNLNIDPETMEKIKYAASLRGSQLYRTYKKFVNRL